MEGRSAYLAATQAQQALTPKARAPLWMLALVGFVLLRELLNFMCERPPPAPTNRCHASAGLAARRTAWQRSAAAAAAAQLRSCARLRAHTPVRAARACRPSFLMPSFAIQLVSVGALALAALIVLAKSVGPRVVLGALSLVSPAAARMAERVLEMVRAAAARSSAHVVRCGTLGH